MQVIGRFRLYLVHQSDLVAGFPSIVDSPGLRRESRCPIKMPVAAGSGGSSPSVLPAIYKRFTRRAPAVVQLHGEKVVPSDFVQLHDEMEVPSFLVQEVRLSP